MADWDLDDEPSKPRRRKKKKTALVRRQKTAIERREAKLIRLVETKRALARARAKTLGFYLFIFSLWIGWGVILSWSPIPMGLLAALGLLATVRVEPGLWQKRKFLKERLKRFGREIDKLTDLVIKEYDDEILMLSGKSNEQENQKKETGR